MKPKESKAQKDPAEAAVLPEPKSSKKIKPAALLSVFLAISLAGNIFQAMTANRNGSQNNAQIPSETAAEPNGPAETVDTPELSLSEEELGEDATVPKEQEAAEELTQSDDGYFEYASNLLNKQVVYDQGGDKHGLTVHRIARDVKVNGVVDGRLIAFYVTIENLSTNDGNYALQDFRLEEWESYGGEIYTPVKAFDFEGEAWDNSNLAPNGKKSVVVVFKASAEGTLEWIPLGLDHDNPVSIPYHEPGIND